MTIREAIRKGTIELKTNNIEEPNIKARLLMQAILNKDRQYLLVYDSEKLKKSQEEKYLKSIDELIDGKPLQYITHSQEFMKMNFFVNEDVLIPRPDTEILVEEVIDICKNRNKVKILDLCTGSGAIAVSLAKYLKNSEVVASDISKKAIAISKKNAKSNKVEDRITFIESDLFKKIKKEKYDVIVSNPPYIKKRVIKSLNKEVQKEPSIALDGGEDGLEFYRKIINESYNYLKFGGYLCLEIGYDQKQEVVDLIKKENKYLSVYTKKDFGGNDRIVIAQIG